MKRKLSLAVVLLSSVVSACTWVKVNSNATNVHVVGRNNLAGCEQLGWVGVATRAELLFDIQRSPVKVKTELETLARNAAADRGADSIVAKSDVKNGKQDFDIYRCR